MTEQELIKQLKAAKAAYDKKFAPTPEAVQRMRAVLMARIAQSNVTPVTLSKTGRSIAWLRYFVPASFAYGMALFVLLAVPASAAYLSRTSLPGQSLYQAKILTEQAQARLISNPASRARKQMENAGNRLEEAKTLSLQNPSAGDEITSQAITRFTEEIKTARATLKEAGDPEQVSHATKIIAEKASQYRQTIEETKKVLTPPVSPVEVSKPEETPSALPITFPVDPGKMIAPIVPSSQAPAPKKPSRSVALAALDEAERTLDEVTKSDDQGDTKLKQEEGLKNGEVGL